jgi:serine/threonine-protein kinase
MLESPIQIPNFRLIEPIGQGGMGVVWLAQQERPDRMVAVKIVAPGDNIPPALLELLRSEGDIAAKFQHAHLVTVHECGLIDDHYYMVMELLPGGDLEDRIQNGLDADEALEVAKSIASGLAHIHAKGFIHRDLKPANVLFTEEGGAVLTDFGISKAMDTEGLMTRLGYTTGTPAYMSPEQITGQPLDGRSDLYALGIVIFEMLSGRLPFDADSDHRLKELQISAPPPSLPEEFSNLQRTLDRLLAKNPEERFGNAETLIRALNGLTEISEEVTQITPLLGHQQSRIPTTERVNVATWFWELGRRRAFWITLATAISVTILVSTRFFVIKNGEEIAPQETIQAEANRVPSVAVLPFEDMSPDKDQEYFSDGLSDTLIHVLAQLSGLKVTAKTSSFSFKGKDDTIAEIAEELKVAHVLEGSVQKSGNRVRVIAQLINVDDGTHLWSKSFDRDLEDIFAVQDEIAQEVVRALKVTLFDTEEQRLEKRHQPTLEAYEQLIQGRREMAKRTADGLAVAEQHFEQAIELDPDYALAYVGLADTYDLQLGYADLVMEESLERRQPLIEKALTLDPLSGEAYTARASIHLHRQELEAAEEDFLMAVELNPNYATAHHWYSLLLSRQGRFEEALTQSRVAAEVDPMSPLIRNNMTRTLWDLGRVEEALTLFRRNIERNPEYPGNYRRMANVHTGLGHLGKAQRWIDEAWKRNAGGALVWRQTCYGFLNLGDALSAADCANQLREVHPQKSMTLIVWAGLHIYRQEWDAAMTVLEALRGRFPERRYLTRSLANLHASKGDTQTARRLMVDAFPELLEDGLELAATDLDAALVFAAILNANGETQRRDALLVAMEERIATMHRTRGYGYGPLDVYIHALRGDHNRAIAGLLEAIDMGWRASRDDSYWTWSGCCFWWQLRQDWKLSSLHQDPEFIALVNELEADIRQQREWYEENKNKPLL